MSKYLLITADCNDADYVSEKTEITDEELNRLRPVINAIKARSENLEKARKWPRHNWVTSEYGRDGDNPIEMYPHVSEELITEFGEHVPPGGGA